MEPWVFPSRGSSCVAFKARLWLRAQRVTGKISQALGLPLGLSSLMDFMLSFVGHKILRARELGTQREPKEEIHLPAMSPFLPHGHQRLFMGWPWETEGKVHEAGRSPTVGSPVLWVFPPFWSHFVAGLLGPVGQPLTTK